MVRLRMSALLWSATLAAGLAGPAHAQVPSVSFAFPPGGKAGTKASVTIGGGNLQGATQLLLSGSGVQAQITKAEAGALTADLTIAADAQPGLREVRVVTPRGTSNAGRIWIGAYPDVNEAEPNNLFSQSQKLATLPATVNGQINGGEDVDHFTFHANAGETFVFDLVAAQMASPLDGYLTLYDEKGRVVETALESFGRDPRLIHTFKTAGTYTVQVRDTLYRGGGNFTYRLTVGKVPAITGYLPRGGKRGETVMVRLQGVNLGNMATLPVQIPATDEPVVVAVNTPAGPAVDTLSLVPSDVMETVEIEPNNEAPQAMSVPQLPIAISGQLDKPGETDLYRIKPTAEGNLSFEIHAHRLESRIDSFIRLMDATGKELQANDDAIGRDSRIVFKVAANTEYLVEVRSQDQSHGGEAFYRLEIAPPAGPDFRLTLTPTEINVGQASHTAVTVNVVRQNGYGGPVAIRVEGLPQGVTATPAEIPAGQASTMFTVSAPASAGPGMMSQIRVIGTATIDGKQVQRVAQAVEMYQPPLADANTRRARPVELLPATTAPQPPYVLNIEPREATVKKGQSVQIKVTATRQMGANKQINLTAAGQPANVNPQLQNIAQDKTEATITIQVAGNAPTVKQNIVISGNLDNNVQAAPAFALTITD